MKLLERSVSTFGAGDGVQEKYRWARCSVPLSAAVLKELGTPLPPSQLQDAVSGLSWEDFQVRISVRNPPPFPHCSSPSEPCIRLTFAQTSTINSLMYAMR